VVRVGGRLVILKWIVVGNVVVGGRGTVELLVLRRADRSAIGVARSGGKAALKPAPGDALTIEKIADIEPRHRNRITGGSDAIVEGGQDVADHGPVHKGRRSCAGVVDDSCAVGLTGDEIQVAESGWPERSAEEVVAEGEVLGIIPDGGDGVAVVITHDEPFALPEIVAVGLGGAVQVHELVHQSVIHGFLLVGVAMALVADDGLRARQPERLHRVGIVRQQGTAQSVHPGGSDDQRSRAARRRR